MEMWRQLTAWIGGVGIIVLFIAVFPRLRIGGRQALFKAESAGPELALAATIRESAQRFVVLYLGITAAEVAILSGLGFTGIDDRDDLLQRGGDSPARPSRPRASRPEPRSLEALRARHAMGAGRLHARRGDELRAALHGDRRPPARGRSAATRSSGSGSRCSPPRRSSSSSRCISQDVLEGEEAVRHGVFNTVSMMTTTGFASDDFALDVA